MITGVTAGQTGTFKIGFVPSTNFVPLQSGPSVSVDDAKVTVTQPDANDQFTAAVDASDTGASFNLTVTGVNDKGATISRAFNVPILAQPPVSITDFTLDQV